MAQAHFHADTSFQFIKEFHKIAKKLVGPLGLMLAYRGGGADSGAMRLLQADLLNLSRVLIDYWCDSTDGKWLADSAGKPSMERTCLLFEMYEFSLNKPEAFKTGNFFEEQQRPVCELKLDQHVSDYLSRRPRESRSFISAFTLELLREFDASKKTNLCSLWKNFLQKIVEKAFLPEVDPLLFPPPNHKEEKLRKLPKDEQEFRLLLIESYEHAAQGGRCSGFRHRLGQQMSDAIKEFIITANTAWRIQQNLDEQSKSLDVQACFNEEALMLASIVMNLYPEPEEQALKLLWDIAPSIGLYGYTESDLARMIKNEINPLHAFLEAPPLSVRAMEQAQALTKGNEAGFAKHTLFNLAVCFCKADGRVTEAEEKILKTFANTLFGKTESIASNSEISCLRKSSPEKTNLPIDDQAKPTPDKDEPVSESDDLQRVDIKNPINEEQPANTQPIGASLSIDKSIAELSALVGLQQVKADVQQLVNFTRIQQLRSSRGMKVAPATRHMLFYGNPGTGKTTVARLVAQIYKDLGVVSKGHLIECDRSGLVGAYAGQTAIKVSEVVNTAVGGILFIDEAYSLNQGDKDSYGLEAIDTLVKLIEDNRDDLVVIAAGYPEKMANFISTNPGLKSRFNRVFSFEDYSPEQLLEIFMGLAKAAGYKVAPDAEAYLAEMFKQMYKARTETFGNGRDVRNVFEAAMSEQANRLVSQADVTAETLSQITLDDVCRLGDGAHFQEDKPAASFGFQPAKK